MSRIQNQRQEHQDKSTGRDVTTTHQPRIDTRIADSAGEFDRYNVTTKGTFMYIFDNST